MSFDFIKNKDVRDKLDKSLDRISRAFDELLDGYNHSAENTLNEVVRVKNYGGLVRVEKINFYSFCEHHFAPFFGVAEVVYEPNEIITGLGKIVRLVKYVHARRLQIQETMTSDIAEDIVRCLKPKGVFVKTSAKHMCVCSRGPNDDTAETVVMVARGSLSWMINPSDKSQY